MARLYLIKLNLYLVPQCYILNQFQWKLAAIINNSLPAIFQSTAQRINKEKISGFISWGNKLVHLTRLWNFNQFKGAIDRILILREDVGLFLKFPVRGQKLYFHHQHWGNVTQAIMSSAEGVKNIIRILWKYISAGPIMTPLDNFPACYWG